MSERRTTAKGERTRQRIIAAASDRFHQYGVNATSLSDVLRASGTGKGQFYQHFPRWDDLVATVLSSHAAFLASQPPVTTWQEVEGLLVAHLDAQRAFAFLRGCPVGTAAYALQPEQETPRALLSEAFAHLRTNVRQFLTAEQQAGRLAPHADPRGLADFAIAATQGGLLLSLLDRDGAAAAASIDGALAYLRGFIIPGGERHSVKTDASG